MPYKDPKRQKEAQKASYLRNKYRHYERSKQTRKERTGVVNTLKEASPCMDCGVFYPHFVMDFDHRTGEEKTAPVSLLLKMAPMAEILLEIEKCDLVCANCHRYRTQERSSL